MTRGDNARQPLHRQMLFVMLAFSALALPTVSSQGYMTVASQLTSTQTFTVGSKPITILSQPEILFDSAFKVNSTTGTKHGCETLNITFVGGRGQNVFGNLTSIIPIDFYIMADPTYRDWLRSKSCGSLPPSILTERTTTLYSFNVTLPDSGLWDILLVNYSNTRDANGYMVALLSSGSLTVTEAVLSTVTHTILIHSCEQTLVPIGSLYLIGSMIAVVIAIVLATAAVVRRKQMKNKLNLPEDEK
jgi:hypothetical protein